MLNVAFVWHMHQPFYKDPENNLYRLPWVRLHAIKDYFDMVEILDNFPAIHQTFNLTPSLLEQIKDYSEGKASDLHLELSKKPASALTEEDAVFLLKDFFMANWRTMIDPYLRYRELLDKRGRYFLPKEISKVVKRFTTEDLRDLQVWFNLTWFDPLFKENDELLIELIKKGKNFTEEEKNLLIEKQFEILRRIIPQYQTASERGQIEISTSPYFHPILPLLCDTEVAKEGLSGVELSTKFSQPEDAQTQIKMGLDYLSEVLKTRPKGLWPSEGSVSEAIIPLLIEEGMEWIATDERILEKSLGTTLRKINKLLSPEKLCCPYLFTKDGKTISIIFRDHFLSDLIGFTYVHWRALDAVEDLIRRLSEVKNELGQNADNSLLTIILDGENAWEFYDNDGRDFLLTLYQRLTKEANSFKCVTISDFLREHPPKNYLPKLSAGSWINGNFQIWIGNREDNQAWKYLKETRDFLTDYERKFPTADKVLLGKAWREIYIAEGSDWCWWYGGEHISENMIEFDALFRAHLRNVYKILSFDSPSYLYEPIAQVSAKEKFITLPLNFINPIIDGKVTDFYEWQGAGCLDVNRIGGTMHRSESLIKEIYYGFNLQNFYLRLEPNFDTTLEIIKNLSVIVEILSPVKKQFIFPLAGEKEKSRPSIAIKRIIEIEIPFELIPVQAKQVIELVILTMKNGMELEKYPAESLISFPIPTADFENIQWTA
ncbi:MAG: glycoside hydrolase family 57 protein [Candidatus Edwardsbacteria bacterium]